MRKISAYTVEFGGELVFTRRSRDGYSGTLALTALGLVLSACGGSSGGGTSDTAPPTLESKIVVVSTPAGSAGERELTLTFSEVLTLKDETKVRLVRTSDDKGEALETEVDVAVADRTVRVDGKNLVVRFTPGRFKVKVVIEVGAIEDESGNGFVVSGDAGTTEEVVPANEVPVFGGDLKNVLSVPEKVGGVVGTYGASDADSGDELTYSLAGDDKDLFEIDGSTGEVSWKTAPDYVAGKEYKFDVVVVDGFGGEVRHSVTVMVTEGTTPPTLESKVLSVSTPAGSPNDRELTLTFSEVLTLKDETKVRLVQTSDAAGEALDAEVDVAVAGRTVSVSGKNLVVTFTPEGKSKYKVVIESGAIEDEAGNGFAPSGDAGTTEEVVPLNTAPVFVEGLLDVARASEKVGGVVETYGASDADSDTLTYTLEGENKDLFNIDALTGEVSWKTVAPDYVAGANEYKFDVVVVDGFGGEVRHSVTVTVTEDTTPPTLDSKIVVVTTPDGAADKRALTLTFSENLTLKDGDKVNLVRTTDDKGVALTTEETVAVGDRTVSVDGKNLVVTFTPGRFKVKVVIGAGAIEDESGNEFVVSGGAGTTEEVVPVNTAPVFGDDVKGSVSVSEKVGGVVGTYGASDADGDGLTYDLEGDDKDLFEIVGAGEVSWKNPAPAYVDGGDNDYEFDVVVVDGFGGEVRHSVTVTVTEALGLLPPSKVELFDADDLDTGVTGLTNKRNLTTLKVKVSEALVAGDSVEFFDGETSLDVVTLTGAVAKGGDVTLTLDDALSTDKTYELTAKVTKGGVTSGASTSLSVTLDLTPPAKPTLGLQEGEINGGKTYVKVKTVTLTLDNLEVGGSVVVSVDGVARAGVTIGGTSQNYLLEELAEGDHEVVVKVVDKAGNESTSSGDLVFTVDTIAPAKPTVELEGGGTTTADLSPTLSLKNLEVGGTVVITVDGKEVLSFTTDASTRDYDLTELVEKSYSVVVRVVDKAGNETVSDTFNFAVEVPPTFSMILHSRTPEGVAYSDPLFEVSELVSKRVALYEGTTRVSAIVTTDADGKAFLRLLGSAEVVKNDNVVAREVGTSDAHVVGKKSQTLTLSDLDTTKPTVVADSLTATVDNTYITVTFSEALGYSDKSAFTVTGGTVSDIFIDPSDSTRVKIQFDNLITAQVYTVKWTAGAVADGAGNEVEAKETALSVTASASTPASDTDAPVFGPLTSFGTVSGDYNVTIVANEKIEAVTDALKISAANAKFYEVDGAGKETEFLTFQGGLLLRDSALNFAFSISAGTSFTVGNHYRIWVNAGVVNDVADTPNTNAEWTYDFIYEGVEEVDAGKVATVFHRGLNDVLLSDTGEEGLSVVDEKTLRVNFVGDVKRGYDDRIVVEKKVGENYETVSEEFLTSFSGKALTLTFEDSLEVGSSYRVKLGVGAVKESASGRFSGTLTTETDNVDFTPPVLVDGDGDDTNGDQTLTLDADKKVLTVWFDDVITAVDNGKITVSDGTDLVTGGVIAYSGSTVTITFEDSLSATAVYTVTIGAGGVTSAGGVTTEDLTTSPATDTIPPVLADGDTGTNGVQSLTYDSVNEKFVIHFNEAIVVDVGDLTVANFQLRIKGDTTELAKVTGYTLTVVDKTVELTLLPDATLEGEHEVVIASGAVKDTATTPNTYGGGTTSFAEYIDTNPPLYRGINLDKAAKTITLRFHEELKAEASITSGIEVGRKPFGGSLTTLSTSAWTAEVTGKTIVITITFADALTDGALEAGDGYVVGIEVGTVEDVAGNKNVDPESGFATVPTDASLDDDSDLVGLSVTSDADYGF